MLSHLWEKLDLGNLRESCVSCAFVALFDLFELLFQRFKELFLAVCKRLHIIHNGRNIAILVIVHIPGAISGGADKFHAAFLPYPAR